WDLVRSIRAKSTVAGNPPNERAGRLVQKKVDRLLLKTMAKPIAEGANIRRRGRRHLPNALRTTRSTLKKSSVRRDCAMKAGCGGKIRMRSRGRRRSSDRENRDGR